MSKTASKMPVVAQSHELVFADYRINWSEYKFFHLLCYLTSKDKEHVRRFSVTDLCDTLRMDLGENRYTFMRRLTYTMMHKDTIEFPFKGGIRQVHILRRADYRGGGVEIEMDEYFLPHLLKLQEQFTLTPLNDFLNLPSFTAGRLFVLVNTLKALRIPSKRVLTVNELTRFLGLGVDRPYYKIKQAIDRAQGGIQERTSYTFKLEEIKEARAVAALRFDHIAVTHRKETNRETTQTTTARLRR